MHSEKYVITALNAELKSQKRTESGSEEKASCTSSLIFLMHSVDDMRMGG